jgi:NADPH-dependent 2,4-dienoyl-CoA reductase/sulfur reductase-like enzyme
MMLKEKYDVIVIGAGPAGLAAAIEAKKTGAQDVLVIERAQELGGILQQCIHNGFGLLIFKKDLPGPAYAQRFIDELAGLHIDTLLDAMALNVTSVLSNWTRGLWCWLWAAVSERGHRLLCREQGRRACIPRERPSALLISKALCLASAS